MKTRLFLVLAILLAALPLAGQSKTALVIGNSSYRHFPALRQSVGEARRMSAALKRMGFEVQLVLDGSEEKMRLALVDFEDTLKRRGGIALFHYGGHGVQVDGSNFLIPVDANIRDERLIRSYALDVDEILGSMEISGSDANIVILDACRDNPLPGGSRSGTRGLAAVSRPPPNSIVVYAAAAGETASDGLFTPALLKYLETPGVSFTEVLRSTRNEVYEASGGRQRPGAYSELLSWVYLAGAPVGGGVAPATVVKAPSAPVATAPAARVERPRINDGFVLVRGGTFRMGSTDSEAYSDETPIRSVTLDGFWISPYEVTQDEYEAVIGENPSYFKGGNRPVEQVSWYDAVEYCNALSRREGLEAVYSGSGDDVRADFSRNGYRLPTEAEWEYAARGGRSSEGYKYSGSGSVGRVAWYGDNSGGETHAVGGKASNELGLYDMSGNVDEWVWDWRDSDYYDSGAQRNPRGPGSGEDRVFRGGSWVSPARYVRSSIRGSYSPGYGYYDLGFRPCRTAD